MSTALLEAIELAARLARAERRAAEHAERARSLNERVAAFLAANPEASTRAVQAEVRGMRSEIIRAIHAHRERFLGPGNHTDGGAA